MRLWQSIAARALRYSFAFLTNIDLRVCFSYTWNWNDSSDAAYSSNVSHTFTAPGVYHILLIVSNAAETVNETVSAILMTVDPTLACYFLSPPCLTLR